MEELKHTEITGKVIGAAREVYKVLGNGFQEEMYRRALAIELPLFDLNYTWKLDQVIYYRNIRLGTQREHFFVEDKVSVEIKTVIKLEDVHLAQALNYLEAYNLEEGLLINFGGESLEFKRLINTKYRPG